MTSFFNLIFNFCSHIISMMSSSRLTSILGAPFIYYAICLFIMWIVVNTFVIRPFVGGSLVDAVHHSQINIKSSPKTDKPTSLVLVNNVFYFRNHPNNPNRVSSTPKGQITEKGTPTVYHDVEFTDLN